MARLLIIVPPLTGHINPTVSLGQSLIKNGHQVAWVGFEDQLRRSLSSEYEVLPLQTHDAHHSSPLSAEELKQRERRGFAGLHFLWERFLIPLAQETVDQVKTHLRSAQPDLCIVDQQMFSGALACQQLNIPYVTSATTSAAVIDALSELPQISAWSRGLLYKLWEEHGLPHQEDAQLDLSPLGTLVFSSQRLTQCLHPQVALPPKLHFVGPALEGTRAEMPFPWDKLDPERPKLFFSMGTVNAERAASLCERLCKALQTSPIQVIAASPTEYFHAAPEHWIIQQRVPQLKLLAHVDAVFCHGGHNTTLEALAYGLPLLITPIRDDQPVIAEQVKRVGAGIRAHFQRCKPAQLRTYIDELLTSPTIREAAQQVRSELMGTDFMQSLVSTEIPARLSNRLGGVRGAEVIEQILEHQRTS